LLGNGIFTQEGAAWKHSRELLRKQFARINYKDLRGSFGEHVDNLIASCPSAGILDFQPLFFNLTLDSTTDLLLGRSVYSLRANIDQAEDNRKFSESFSIAQEGLAKRFRLAPFHSLYHPSSFRKACRDVHRFVEEYIRSEGIMLLEVRPADSLGREKKKWFVHEVAAECGDEKSLRDQLLNVLLAGRDTTACCLSWTL
jgi:cytochrome P450